MAQLLIDKVKELEHKIDTMKNQRADDLNLIESLEYATQKSAERLLDLQSDYSNKVMEIADLKWQLQEAKNNAVKHQALALNWMKQFDSRQKEVYEKNLQLAEAREDTERLRRLLKELYAVVWGECPSLLNEDSGGDARLDHKIREAIDAAREDK